jgi:hypothetical protein
MTIKTLKLVGDEKPGTHMGMDQYLLIPFLVG